MDVHITATVYKSLREWSAATPDPVSWVPALQLLALHAEGLHASNNS